MKIGRLAEKRSQTGHWSKPDAAVPPGWGREAAALTLVPLPTLTGGPEGDLSLGACRLVGRTPWRKELPKPDVKITLKQDGPMADDGRTGYCQAGARD